MEVETVDQIVRRIEAAVEERRGGAVAFDGDGTLWSGDVGEDFFFGVLETGDIREPAMSALRREAREAGLADAGTGAQIGRRIYDAYLAHAFDEERVCEIMTWICAGYTRAELAVFCKDVLVRHGLAARLHQEVQSVVAWAKSSGITTYLVSASPFCIVEAAADIAGVPRENVVAAHPATEGDAILSSVLRPIPYGAGKVTRLRERLGAHPLYAAFGDNAFDVAMLREAAVAVAVRPKPRLSERAADVPGLVRIAPPGG